jgi:ABC-type multidrug transport system ATPase subunit/pSer/pThr/pTyr-binding forkhead associated (FHA) protein
VSTAQTTPAGSITFLTGPLAGQAFQLNGPMITIGRETYNDIVVRGDLHVSRRHVRLVWEAGTWRIENLSEQNPLFVDNQPVKQALLHDKSLVIVGQDTTFIFHAQPAQAALNEMPAQGASPSAPAQPQPAPPVAGPGPTVMAGAMLGGTAPGMPVRYSQTLLATALNLGLPALEVSSSTSGSRKIIPLDKPTLSIGRNVTNDIVIDDPSVSDMHLQIVREGNQFVLIHPHPERQKTTNGLLHQGRKIRGDESYRKVLAQGDIFRIGDADGALVTLSYSDGSGKAESAPPLQPIRLGEAEVTIGRKPDNSVVLNHPQVSAHHARLVREGGSYRILDLHSTNHVYVNAQLVTSHLLKMGDEIRIGPYRLIYESTQLTQYDESNYIRIDALNLHRVAANRTTLLNNISLSLPPRAFVALVGGSGAGKTTLLDALSGLRPPQQGKVFYNGQDYYRNMAAFSTQIGYVPQDDIVHGSLTVERALYYAAKIRLPSDFTDEQIWQRISEVLEDVELAERRKLLIKRLSGGQRKRVSIAMELLGNPGVFFLDEPTSGLDPGLDRKMMVLLRKLADKGHTIILVTHATNNINVCDVVYFLAQGGRLAYAGPPDQAKEFFGKTDFAEIYTALTPTEERPDLPEEAEARFKSSPDYQMHVVQPIKERTTGVETDPLKTRKTTRRKPARLLKQFLVLSQRNIELLKNDRATLLLLLLQAPLIALFLMLLVRVETGAGVFEASNIVQCRPQILTSTGPIGFTATADLVNCDQVVTFLKNDPTGAQYAQAHGGVNQALQDFIVPGVGLSAQRVLFLCGFIAVLSGILNSIREIVKEGPIYRRERTVNLGIIPYVLSKVLVLTILALYQSAALLLIVNAFEPLHQGVFLPVFVEAYIPLALSALVGMMLGLLVSSLVPNEDTANSLIPFVLIPQIFFAGVEIPLKDGVMPFLALFFPTRWTMASLGTSLGVHADKLGGDVLFGSNLTYQGTLFSIYSQSDAINRIELSWAVMGVMVIVFALLICATLKRQDSR